MSGFSSVDDATDTDRLVRFLDHAADAEAGIKHYTAAAHALRRPARPIVDVGCGAGHDLAILASHGIKAVGVDPSAAMMQAASQRAGRAGAPLVRAAGEQLPFATGSFDGCRIERVLMHAEQPALIVGEAVRCVRTGGLITVFEPDWSSLTIRSEVLPGPVFWISQARHPDVGGQLWDLLEDAGCEILDRIEELSVWRSLRTLEQVAGFPAAVDRAVAAARLDPDDAYAWISEQRRLDGDGQFHATIAKILVVATRR